MLWVLGVLTLYITKEIRNRTWYTSNQTIRTEYITDGVKCFIRQFKVVKCRFHTSRFFHSINSKSNNGGNKDSFNNTPKMLDDFIDDKIHNGDIINGLPTKSKQNQLIGSVCIWLFIITYPLCPFRVNLQDEPLSCQNHWY